MDLSNSNTIKNLESAFGGESMANRKYLFFAEVTKQLGMPKLSKLFRETANQETEHAFAHFRLLHPELVIDDASQLTIQQKQAIAAQCLQLAIDGETYEYTTMYPGFAQAAQADRDSGAVAEFTAQTNESQDHATTFHTAAKNFGLLTYIENHHANQYTEALQVMQGETAFDRRLTQKWICQQCSMIYDPMVGDPDSGITAGTAFEAIPVDWICPICGATKKTFIPYQEIVTA